MENRAVTENEKAINILEHMKNLVTVRIFEEEALDRAIKALEEVQQYREIGTPEECQAAMEKQPVFNMDKVVEQLEKKIQTHKHAIEYEKKNGTITEEFQQRKAVEVLEGAIDIVKAGGVDD